MSILSSTARAYVRATTMVDPIIIDRVADAYDALLRDDVEGYKRYMMIALAIQQGVPVSPELATGGIQALKIPPIEESDRPTAIDKVKTVVMMQLKEKWGMRDLKQVAKRLEEMLSG